MLSQPRPAKQGLPLHTHYTLLGQEIPKGEGGGKGIEEWDEAKDRKET